MVVIDDMAKVGHVGNVAAGHDGGIGQMLTDQGQARPVSVALYTQQSWGRAGATVK